MSESWKLTLPCTRAEAEALDEEFPTLAALDPAPVLMTREIEPDNPDRWQLEAYFEGKPGKATVAAIRSLIPGSAKASPTPERLPDEDWVTLSQQGLNPITVGRFHIRNGVGDPELPGHRNFLIGAGRAFGTGQHETTSGCLLMLDRLRRLGARFGNVADIGTGTGVLAFAALHLWPRAYALASDIDAAAVDVAAENARLNGVALGRSAGRLVLVTAAGTRHPTIGARVPYDLVIANILAGPLIELAPSLCDLVEDGGTLVLAGLLDTQAGRVLAAYRAQGMRLADRIDRGQWPILRLRKRPQGHWRRPRRQVATALGEAPGFGSW